MHDREYPQVAIDRRGSEKPSFEPCFSGDFLFQTLYALQYPSSIAALRFQNCAVFVNRPFRQRHFTNCRIALSRSRLTACVRFSNARCRTSRKFAGRSARKGKSRPIVQSPSPSLGIRRPIALFRNHQKTISHILMASLGCEVAASFRLFTSCGGNCRSESQGDGYVAIGFAPASPWETRASSGLFKLQSLIRNMVFAIWQTPRLCARSASGQIFATVERRDPFGFTARTGNSCYFAHRRKSCI